MCAERWLHPSAVHVNAIARRGSGGSNWFWSEVLGVTSGSAGSSFAFAGLGVDELARKAPIRL